VFRLTSMIPIPAERPVPFRSFPAAACTLALFFATACVPPSFLFNREEGDPRELAARREMREVEQARDLGASIPRWRFERIVKQYPQTTTAYEATLILARDDFATLDALRQTSTSKKNQEGAFREFIETYAFGPHSQPREPEMAEAYRRDLHPLLYDALDWLGDFELQFRYIQRFPGIAGSAKLRQSIEEAIVRPERRWEAVRLLEAYAQLQPRSPNIAALEQKIQENLLVFIEELGTKQDCDTFLEHFPDSPHRETVLKIKRSKTI